MAIRIWRNLRLIIADVIFFSVSFLFALLIFRTKGVSDFFSLYFFTQLAIWLAVSALFMKYAASPNIGMTRIVWVLLLCNTIILLISILGVNRLFADHTTGKKFYIFVIFLVTVFELFFFGFIQSYLVARQRRLWESEDSLIAAGDAGWNITLPSETEEMAEQKRPELGQAISSEVKALIIKEIGIDAYEKLSGFLEDHPAPMLVVSTNTRFNIDIQPLPVYGTIVNLARINEIRYINKFFEVVNDKLVDGGIYIGMAEVYSTRKRRIMGYYPVGVRHLVYTLDYLITRVVPKLPVTKKIYFAVTKGKSRVISRTETLGRLYCCGFEVGLETEANGYLFFAARKIRKPYYDNNPTYGPLITLNRVGLNGNIIGIYKLRTMHPYSEYLQPYIYEKNRLREGGKIRDDFRVTTIGAFARRFWIDELPMLINLFRGEVKLVGVRPLSQHFFNLYTPGLKKKRTMTKPGLIPPYYADMPKTLDEVMASEERYLDEYFRAPMKTDLKYLRRALYQILVKRARSG